MRMNIAAARALIVATVTILAATGLTAVSAQAAITMSSRYILNHLVSGPEHSAGYDRAKFTLWDDSNGDGCDTRAEVVLAEALIRPAAGGYCDLGSGLWLSRYDGVITKDSSTFDVDHMVPLNEAWQIGRLALVLSQARGLRERPGLQDIPNRSVGPLKPLEGRP
jgi:hypothetical protein